MNFALMTYHAQNLFRLTILSRHVKYLDSIHGFCNDDSTSLIFAEATCELWFVSKNRTSIASDFSFSFNINSNHSLMLVFSNRVLLYSNE